MTITIGPRVVCLFLVVLILFFFFEVLAIMPCPNGEDRSRPAITVTVPGGPRITRYQQHEREWMYQGVVPFPWSLIGLLVAPLAMALWTNNDCNAIKIVISPRIVFVGFVVLFGFMIFEFLAFLPCPSPSGEPSGTYEWLYKGNLPFPWPVIGFASVVVAFVLWLDYLETFD